MEWTCNGCSFLNNFMLNYCEMCNTQNENKNTDEVINNGNESNDCENESGVFSQLTSYWKCSMCEYKFNMYDDNKCLMCDIVNTKLPPTYLLLRRQLRSDWNRGESYVEIFRNNIIVYRNCVDTESQSLLLDDCNQKLNVMSMPGISSKDKPGPTHGFSYQTGWVPGNNEDKKEGHPHCLELATNLHSFLISELHDDIVDLNQLQINNALQIPDKFHAHSLWARQYMTSQGLGFHLDPQGCDWVFIISLGCDTHFQLYGISEKEENIMNVTLKSGDAIFFNGTNIHHSIKEIIKGTQPSWWVEKTYDRIGLQMRGHLGQTVINRKTKKPMRKR